MRILSQNKEISTTYGTIGVKEVKTPIKTKSLKKEKVEYTISAQLDGMYGVPLGTYKTKERALEIIKAITKCTVEVYEMPEE